LATGATATFDAAVGTPGPFATTAIGLSRMRQLHSLHAPGNTLRDKVLATPPGLARILFEFVAD